MPKSVRPLRVYCVQGVFDEWLEVDHTICDATLPEHRGWWHHNPEHWQWVRLQAFKRDGFRCRMCNGQDDLQGHHRTYDRWGKEWVTDITTVCKRCHQRHHGISTPSTEKDIG